MKSKISALMDGELMEGEIADPMRALREPGEALQAWRTYHLISDAMQDTPILSSGFSARFAERLALEPTVLAPGSIPSREGKPSYRLPLSAAASLAAAVFVFAGWSYFQNSPAPQIAQVKPAPIAAAAAPTVRVPLSGEVNDYLLAHQNYSPRSTLQGVAPYVRTVSDSAQPR